MNTPKGLWKPENLMYLEHNIDLHGADYLELSGGFMIDPCKEEPSMADLFDVSIYTKDLSFRNIDEIIDMKKSLRNNKKTDNYEPEFDEKEIESDKTDKFLRKAD